MLRIRDMMTSDLLTLAPDTSVREAMEALGRAHVSGAPVVSGGKLVGVISTTDLMTFASALSGIPVEREAEEEQAAPDAGSVVEDVESEDEATSTYFADFWDESEAGVAERVAYVEGPEWNVLEEHDVSEAMTPAPLATLGPEASVESAADLMRTRHIHRVLVTEGDKLVGVLSSMDIATAAADRRFTKRTYVFNRDRDFNDTR